MREILFRGKRVDNGAWITDSKTYIEDADGIWLEQYNEETGHEVLKVQRETVGQYTGLTDKNGKKIFEGDILKIITAVKGDWIIDENGHYKEPKREDCGIVQEDKKTSGYKLKVYHNGKYKRIAKYDIAHICYYDAKVIGNIYDNPELLEAIK